MVFKRRERRGILRTMGELFYPRGGWARAIEYVKKRLQRLPGTPETIARGVFAGVLVSFSPLLGLHMILAAVIALSIRGSVIAALLATFIGNPITYPLITLISLRLGNFLLGLPPWREKKYSVAEMFVDAGDDLYQNFLAMFTEALADWSGILEFWHVIFLPFLAGGLILGVTAATLSYVVMVPLIRVYQNRRKGRIAAKLAELRANAAEKVLRKDREGKDDEQ